MDRKNSVRAKFLGILALIVVVLLLLILILEVSAVLYTCGTLVSLSFLTYKCFTTDSIRFSGVLSLTQARITYVSSIAIGLVLQLLFSVEYSVSWYISAILFVFYEPIIFGVIQIIGGVNPLDESQFK